VHPLYQLLGEHFDTAMTDPRAELRAALDEFLAHADLVDERWGAAFYRRLAPKMREFAADVPRELLQ